MATTDCGFGKIVSFTFMELELTNQYKWVNESVYYMDFTGDVSIDCKWVLKRLVKCPYLGNEYWIDVAAFTEKPYNSH